MSPSIEDPVFNTIAIVGLGLIGGSIALGVRERWPSVLITGVDDPSVLAHARGSGAIERAAVGVSGIGDVDLIVLAAPVRQNVVLLREIAAGPHGHAVVTDVGGTKRTIVTAAREIAAPVTFVGGHPIGGAEKGGFGFARPDLFSTRPWIFTPDDTTDGEALARLCRFAEGLGARPSTMSPDAHDRAMAFVSHLPQLTASALMDTVGADVGADGLKLAGRGLADTTRLASSPADVWRDICATNADAIGDALDRLITRLTDLRGDLSRGEAIASIFGDAAHWRAELMKGRD
jgi:prephenate dehydrogenase